MSDNRDGSAGYREVVTVWLLAVTAILTAWAGFESSKWGGEMTVAFSQASAARTEAARLDATSVTREGIQVGLFTQWLTAAGAGDDLVADFLVHRFPEPLATAHADWLAVNPLTDPGQPQTPFAMPSYVLDEQVAALAADQRADQKSAQGLDYSQHGDDYTLVVVLFAVVLFFTAITGRVSAAWAQWTLLGVAVALFTFGTVALIALPKII